MEEGVTIRSSRTIVSTLLGVEKEGRMFASPGTNVIAVIVCIINLLVCGVVEQWLKEHSPGYHTFLYAHSAVYLMFALSYFAGNSEKIVYRSRIFRTAPAARLTFVAVGVLRHPYSIALLSSNSLFLAVQFRRTLPALPASIIMYLLLMAGISVIAAVVSLCLSRANKPPGTALVAVVLMLFASLAGPLYAGGDTAVMEIPLVSSCAEGILAASTGNLPAMFIHTGVLLVLPVTAAVLGRRYV